MPQKHFKNILNGRFNIKRSIDNPSITINGEAFLSNENDDLISYVENGHYYINDVKHTFSSQRYFAFEAGLFKILSQDKTTLHEFPLMNSTTPNSEFSHTHKCKDDTYELNLEIKHNLIKMHYTILGPAKNIILRLL